MRADRLLQLLFLLRRHGRLPARRLAELLEVSERTVLRDMEALSAAGVPVYCEQGRGGGCVLMEGYETDVSGLTADEAQALFAWTTQGAAADLGLGPQLGTALTKLSATVPQPALERADALAAVVVVDRRRWFAAAEEVPLLPVLREAATARRRVRLGYAGRDGAPSTRTVDPYGLVENAGRWYLLAAHRGVVKSFRASRITSARPLEDAARVPPDLDLAAEWARVRSAFETGREGVDLVLAVDPRASSRFRAVAGSQLATGTIVESAPEAGEGEPAVGWPRLRLTVRARQAAVALVLGFGGEVLLLEPCDLVVEARERALAAVRLHDGA